MTASLPVPQDAHPTGPDGARGGARGQTAPVTALPPKPKTPAEVAAQQDAGSPPAPKRPKRAPRKKPQADPGPPPPLPPDLVIPPKPPLPPVAEEEATEHVEPEAPNEIEAEIETETLVEQTDTPDLAPALPADEPEASTATDAEAAALETDEPEVTPMPVDEPEVQPLPVDEPEVQPLPVDEPVVPPLPVVDEPEDVVDAPAPAIAPDPEPAIDHAPEAPAEPAAAEPAVAVAVAPVPLEHAAEIAAPPAAEVPEVLVAAPIAPSVALGGSALVVKGVTKAFGDTRAVDGIDLTVPTGIFYGLVGPNGAGKTTTLSMIAGLLRPDRGSIRVNGVDAVSAPLAAKRQMGVLPDRLRTFDRLTGRQLLHYYGVLRGLPSAVVESRTNDLARAFDLSDSLGRVVSDYSAGMVKKVMLAGAMIHSPRLLVLDEPFEAVDPVSSAIILDILKTYVAHGGTVILSSHGMDLVERVCSRVAVIVAGQVLAEGTVDEVRGELTLEQRFIELAGGLSDVEGLEWLHTFSD
ncbi:ABC-2 type transport system ATP-binding protein [Microbacterium sp. cf046]|uniref:ABC transporter ATP-binding protein n=1 Tax=Microbacterium sp. cf046 TaxID=1761803 RepID=UPI0008F37FFD|nr:ABC transporter ATP-binding protein [Microbacterium sp. cf046]SFS07846.1 ABC-2 type transport system ATP-binding protein [Microbacterium sp. cf046]